MTAVDVADPGEALTVPLRVVTPRRPKQPVDYAVALVAVAVLTWFTDQWAAQLVVVPLVVALPGLILLRALRVDGAAVARAPHLVVSAGLAVLLAVGLVTNFVGPLLGLDRPLTPLPVLVTFEIVNVALLAASWTAPERVDVDWARLRGRVDLLAPLLLPLLAAAGAYLLDNASDDVVALLFLVVAVVVLAATILAADRIDDALAASVVGCVCLGLMWSYSLRGPAVNGFDVAVEYRGALNVIRDGVWPLEHVGDAYGAMASITTLPAALNGLTGMTGGTLFKVVYPALFAAVPVGTYFLARTMLTRRWALIGLVVLLGQRNLAQQMPGLARQEIALAVFVGLLTVLCAPPVRGPRRLVLVGVLALAVVLSHYSTAYVTIALLGVGLLLMAALRRCHRPVTGAALPTLCALLTLVVGAVLWYGVATRSAENVSRFVTDLRQNGLHLLPNAKAGAGLLSNVFYGNAAGAISAEQYQSTVAATYAELPYVHPYPAARDPRYALQDDPLGPPPTSGEPLGYVALVNQQLIYLLAVTGAALIALRRDGTSGARILGTFVFAAVALLVVLKVSGTVASSYNQDRALLQELPVLLVCAGVAMQELARRVIAALPATRSRAAVALPCVAGVTVCLVFAFTTGLLSGSGATGLNLATAGEDFERYHVDQEELDASSWLGFYAPRGSVVSMDRYAQLRYLAMTGRVQGLLLDVTPEALDQQAWVLASTANVVEGRGRGLVDAGAVTYRYPREFLADHFDLVYSNGRAEVYH